VGFGAGDLEEEPSRERESADAPRERGVDLLLCVFCGQRELRDGCQDYRSHAISEAIPVPDAQPVQPLIGVNRITVRRVLEVQR